LKKREGGRETETSLPEKVKDKANRRSKDELSKIQIDFIPLFFQKIQQIISGFCLV
jgi:hypothetical protein